MKLTKLEFLEQPKKAITLMGMSGVGKSQLAAKLGKRGWRNYSCDDLIGSKYLSADNMKDLSEFVGQIGDPGQGGVLLEEFKRRQKLYYEAECMVLCDMHKGLEDAGGNFVNDSSGSMCEVEDENILAEVGRSTLFVYLKVEPEDHGIILERALLNPKPLYFPPAFFDERLGAYCDEFEASTYETIDPQDFLRWVFPYLFESRLPKYQKLADLYGVTIPAASVRNIKSSEQFIEIVAEGLDE